MSQRSEKSHGLCCGITGVQAADGIASAVKGSLVVVVIVVVISSYGRPIICGSGGAARRGHCACIYNDVVDKNGAGTGAALISFVNDVCKAVKLLGIADGIVAIVLIPVFSGQAKLNIVISIYSGGSCWCPTVAFFCRADSDAEGCKNANHHSKNKNDG